MMNLKSVYKKANARILSVILIIIMIIAGISSVFSQPLIEVFINDEKVQFTTELGHPVIRKDRTMVPIRIISENMGYKVDWNKENWSKDKSVYISNADRKITLKIGESTAIVNGKKVNIDERDGKVVDTKSYISSQNRTMVPVRFIAETMGAKVEYNKKGDIHHVIITTKGDSGVIGNTDDGKVEEKPVEKPIEPEKPVKPDVEDKDWIEPEWKLVNGMESDRGLYLYLHNKEEFVKRNARFTTKMVGPNERYRFMNWMGVFFPEPMSMDNDHFNKDVTLNNSPEVFELIVHDGATDKNGKPLPPLKEGDKLGLEIEIKMNGKSKIYQEVFTLPKSY